MHTILTTDMHTGGEPLRIITGGLPDVPGKTVLERRRYFRDHLDHIRTGLLWEPRGHADMYAVVLTPPDSPGADFGAFFLHNEGYSTMCGHAIIALAKFAMEKGLVSREGDQPEVVIDVPAGRIRAKAFIENGKVGRSSFLNVPSFVYLANASIDFPPYGKINLDIAYGGAFYALLQAQTFSLEMIPGNGPQFISLGKQIKKAVMDQYPVVHPFEPDLGFLYGSIFTGPAVDPTHHSRNVCIFADGELDRSATGSGVSARAALLFARGELKKDEKICIESILGTTMEVKIAGQTTVGTYSAIIPEVSGRAWFTGEHVFLFEGDDPLRQGFLLR